MDYVGLRFGITSSIRVNKDAYFDGSSKVVEFKLSKNV